MIEQVVTVVLSFLLIGAQPTDLVTIRSPVDGVALAVIDAPQEAACSQGATGDIQCWATGDVLRVRVTYDCKRYPVTPVVAWSSTHYQLRQLTCMQRRLFLPFISNQTSIRGKQIP